MQLQRLPKKHDKSLRAWDAADRQLADLAIDILEKANDSNAEAWVINDQFGAISCFLDDRGQRWFNDSATSHQAQAINRAANHLRLLEATFPVSHGAFKQAVIEHAPAVVVLRIPKTHSFLSQQLAWLNQLLPKSTPVILGGMQKYVDKSVIDLVKQAINVVEVPRAEKKARLVIAESDPEIELLEQNYGFQSTELGQHICGDANVFCHSQLDIGARVMIDVLPIAPVCQKVLDLACGNGVLGLAYHRLNSPSELILSDDSYQAVQSASTNMASAKADSVSCAWENGVGATSPDRELVLLNPPFHQGHVVGDHIAKQLFHEAAKALASNGELWVVGNRHLGYHVVLKNLFKHVESVSDTRKFVVLRCKEKK